jgi:antitoxin MazE
MFLMEPVRLDLDQIVEVRAEAGQIVVEPVRKKAYRVDDLLKDITAKNLQEPVDFGAPQGKEVW